jgi:hypothetical protein
MRAKNECVSCIFNQALRVCDNLGINEAQTKEVLDAVGARIKDFNLQDSPPLIAKWVYALIAQILNKEDLYKKQKAEATIHAQIALERLKAYEKERPDLLRYAIECSVVGNVIDLAAQKEYDLNEEIENIFHTRFAVDDFAAFEKKFEQAKSVLIIGDNAGEHIFDAYMIALFRKIDPHKTYYFAARNNPIINDITYAQALESPLADICHVVNSGVDTPGLELNEASDEFLALLSTADIVIAKGMGNYESAAYKAGREIFHLLKIKCGVVARDLGKNEGSIIFAKL